MLRAMLPAFAVAALMTLSAQAAVPPLTPDGWGKLRIGMREAAAVRSFKLTAARTAEFSSDACRELRFPTGGPALTVMAEKGRITRISTFRKSPIQTDRGLGVGSREAQVRKAYGARLEVTPHKYVDAPARYLTYWAKPAARGVRYETDEKKVVTRVHVGGPSIEYVEGCL